MLRVSLPGKDARSAPVKHFSVHADYVHPKIKLAQSPPHFAPLSYTFSSDPITAGMGPREEMTLFTINHGYGYKPAVFGTVRRLSTGQQSNLPGQGLFGTLSQGFLMWTTNTQVIFAYQNLGFGGEINVNGETFVFTYYINAESGSL